MQSIQRTFAAAVATVLFSAAQPLFAAEGFTPTGNLGSGGRFGASDALLPSGKVLVAAGINGSNLATAQLYDPAAGTLHAAARSTLFVGSHCPAGRDAATAISGARRMARDTQRGRT